MSMPVPHPVTLGKYVILGKSETTTVLVLVSDTVRYSVCSAIQYGTIRYSQILIRVRYGTALPPSAPAGFCTEFYRTYS